LCVVPSITPFAGTGGLVGDTLQQGGTVAEELAFARKASGLVRGLSMTDAFAVGFMNQGLTPSIWFAITFGLGVFIGGNLIIAALISFALAGFGFPIVWGVLGGSMPRSGGEYIYNSRIVHPIFGIAQSFGDAMIWLMWIYVLAPLAVDPGLTITFNYLGWTGAAEWVVSSAWITFFLATAFNIIGFLFVVFGIKIFALTQKVIMFFGIGGCIAIGLALTISSRANFVANWNADAVASGSPRYADFVAQVGDAAGQVMPTTWGWSATFGCMVAMSWLFAYAYSISFIGGEVKRPDKTIIWSNFFAIAVPFAFLLWIALVLNKTVGYTFLNAAAWNDQNGPIEGFAMPFGSNFIDLAVYTFGTASWYTKLLAGYMGFSYVAFTLWWVALSYLAFPRILFAWGMDRMGPKWFTDISPRWASPVKNYIVCFVLGEALLVLYYTLLTDAMQNIIVTGFQVTSVFIPTAIAALLFPYVKRSKGVWESSPYRTWRFLGVPVVVWGSLVSFVYLGILLYYFVFNDAAKQFTMAGNIILVTAWVLGILWYFFWKSRSRSVGVDVSVTYGELPPE
jgi:APA family basic amino acid/polyamine antiporter